jgi:hypothetical protein
MAQRPPHISLTSMLAVTLVLLCTSSTLPAQTREQTLSTVTSLRLDAQSLAAVGVSALEIPSVLNRLVESDSELAAYLDAEHDVADAQAAIAAANQTLRRYPDQPEAQDEISTAQSALEAATTLRDQRYANIINTLLSGMADTELISAIFTVDGSIARLPAPYRIAAASTCDALKLSDSLSTESVCDAHNLDLPPEAEQILNQARSVYQVQLAHTRMDLNASSIASAMAEWNPSE